MFAYPGQLLGTPIIFSEDCYFLWSQNIPVAATNTFQPNCITRSFKHTVGVTEKHNPFLKMSAPSPIKGMKICVWLTPGSGHRNREHIPSSSSLRGATERQEFMCALGRWKMNIQRDLQRSSFRAGEFTEIAELTCAVLESAFLTFQTFLTPVPRPNQNQPERLRD